MDVKLVSYSKASDEFKEEGLENVQDLIAFCAKVSNPTAQINMETSERLIKYLIKHQHWSPLEMVNAVLRECRLQDSKNRQNSIETDDRELAVNWEIKQQMVINAAREAYEWAIDNGIAKEQARVVLPEGNTKTRLYMNGTLRSWVHYIELRGANGTQKEHMDIAHSCAKVIAEIFPLMNDLK